MEVNPPLVESQVAEVHGPCVVTRYIHSKKIVA